MTSRISFSKLVRDEMRRLNWLLAVQCLVFALLIPFRVLLVLSDARNNSYLKGMGKTLYNVFCEHVGLGHPENTFVILCAGILCALSAFFYLYSAVQLDFYHSLAIRREKLFAAKYLGSTLTFVIPYLAAQVLGILAGACFGAFSSKATVEILAASLQGILFFLCSYSGTLVAILLTGKLLTTILAIGVLGLYIPMISMLYVGLRETFFSTMFGTSGLDTMLEAVLRKSSPWALCMFQYENPAVIGETGAWPCVWNLILPVLAAVVLVGITLLLYRVRKTEAAGKALAFRQLEAAVKLLLTIPSALIAAMVANELLESLVWEVAFILLFGTLGCVIMEFIYRWDIRQVLCHRLHIVITIIAAAAIFFVFRLDLTGYNTYLPKQEELISMAVRYEYMEHPYIDENGLAREAYYADVAKDILDSFETEDFDLYYKLAENGIANVKKDEYSGYTVPVSVKYRLKSGKEIYRIYTVDEAVFLEVFNEKKKSPEFTEAYYPIMSWSEEVMAALGGAECIIYDDLLGSLETAEADEGKQTAQAELNIEEVEEYADEQSNEWTTYIIPDEDIERLVEAYRKDLLDASFEECWDDYGSSLTFQVPATYQYGGYIKDSYPLNENFTNTMEVLQDILKDKKSSGTAG